MFHHVSLGSNDLARSAAFYDPLMDLLGYRRIKTTDRIIAYGINEVAFSLERPLDRHPATVGNGSHVAFHAGSRALVEEFHRTALKMGGTDEGRLVCGPTIPIITQPSCEIRTATRSNLSPSRENSPTGLRQRSARATQRVWRSN